MVIQDEVSSPGTINIPEQTCNIKSFGNENGLSSLEFPETTLSARQHTEVVDNSTEVNKAATMIKLDKPMSCPRCNSMKAKLCHINCNIINKSRYHCKHASSCLVPLTTPPDKLAASEEPEKHSEKFSIACRERTRIVSSSCSLMRMNEDPPYSSNLNWNDKALLHPWNSPTKELIPGGCIPSFTNRSSLLNSAENGNCSEYTSPCFRKHSRDLNSPDEERNDKCVPKTLRIVIDPLEAAKSSIQSTLGVEPGKTDTSLNGYMFRAFQFRPQEYADILEVNRALEANPVALLRSQRYREST